jgi:hypothetical protein
MWLANNRNHLLPPALLVLAQEASSAVDLPFCGSWATEDDRSASLSSSAASSSSQRSTRAVTEANELLPASEAGSGLRFAGSGRVPAQLWVDPLDCGGWVEEELVSEGMSCGLQRSAADTLPESADGTLKWLDAATC